LSQNQNINKINKINDYGPGIEGKPPVFWPQLIRNTAFPSIKIRPTKKLSRNAKRIKGYWQSAKVLYVILYKSLDRRPYAEVRLLDRVVIGLLDTGASLSAIGGKLAEQIIKARVPFKRGASTVNTADGQR